METTQHTILEYESCHEGLQGLHASKANNTPCPSVKFLWVTDLEFRVQSCTLKRLVVLPPKYDLVTCTKASSKKPQQPTKQAHKSLQDVPAVDSLADDLSQSVGRTMLCLGVAHLYPQLQHSCQISYGIPPVRWKI